MEAVTNAYNDVNAALSTAPPSNTYPFWNPPGVEEVKPDEEETAQQIGKIMNKMQKHNFDQHRHCFRATHVKTQSIVKGALTVLPDLPANLQQGLFKTPGKTYDVAARYANEPVFYSLTTNLAHADSDCASSASRAHVYAAQHQDASTQDFIFNNAPMIKLPISRRVWR